MFFLEVENLIFNQNLHELITRVLSTEFSTKGHEVTQNRATPSFSQNQFNTFYEFITHYELLSDLCELFANWEEIFSGGAYFSTSILTYLL